MTQDADLFVQAFWVKCREVIRPEIDIVIGDLRSAGHSPHVSTQEHSAADDGLPAHAGPSLTLSLRTAGAVDGAVHPAIEFHGDVAREVVEVITSIGRRHTYELAAVGPAEVKGEIDEWLTRLALSASI